MDIKLNNRDCILIEKIHETTKTIHIVRMPDIPEHGFYRAAVSFEYWCKRELNNWYENFYLKNRSCPRYWRVIRSFELSLPHSLSYDLSNENCHIVEHETIWNFYKYIGYNYKTQKYEKAIENEKNN